MEYVDVEISDIRIFQHLVLLVDRKDFLFMRDLVKTELVERKNSLLEDYGTAPEVIRKLVALYRYPKELETAILSAVMNNKITEKDVVLYKPGHRTKKGSGIDKTHPILNLRVTNSIRNQRQFYIQHQQGLLLHKQGLLKQFRKHGEHSGYRSLGKSSNKPISTVQTAIKSYIKKLSIIIPWML